MSFLMLITHTHMSWYCICVQCLCLRYILFDLKSRMDVIISLCVITDTASIYYQQCKQGGHINVATLHICTYIAITCMYYTLHKFICLCKKTFTYSMILQQLMVWGSNCLSITQSLYVSQQRIAADVDNKLINAYISLESLHWDNC